MWIAILSSREAKRGRPYRVQRMGEDMVFWRDGDGKIMALRNYCPHRQALLSQGKVVNGLIQCPYHGFEFDGVGNVVHVPAMGRSQKPPSYLKAKSYTLYEQYGIVWMWYGPGQPEAPPKFFDDLKDLEAYAEYWETWNISFLRAVENQLDGFHLPFVHYNTIGRGNRTLINGVALKQIDDITFVWHAAAERDVGQKPKVRLDIDPQKAGTYIEFIYPNLWQNHISENMRVLAFFAPVDPQRTTIYIRFYIKPTGIKSIDKLLARLGMYFNIYILHQDRRVVESQNPDIIGDKLIAPDSPIAIFRRMFLQDKELQNKLKVKIALHTT